MTPDDIAREIVGSTDMVKQARAEALEEAVAEARNTIHCKVRCGCYAYQSAMREARDGERASVTQYGREQYWKGFSTAREQAAKIAEDEPCTHCDVCPKMVGRMIRALSPEDGATKRSMSPDEGKVG